MITEPVGTIGELSQALERAAPGLGAILKEHSFNFVVNGEMILRSDGGFRIRNGDRVELVMALAGGC